jgi:putative acetyltransferase
MSGPPSTSAGPEARIEIRPIRHSSDLEDARGLFREYRAWLVEHREVTNFPDSQLTTGLERFDQELAGLPGDYASPGGELLVAYLDKTSVGCAALRPLPEQSMELKRVFVRPTARGGGIGRRLTTRSLEVAAQLGARRVVLDTLPGMTAAIGLYRELGFRPIQAYWPNPVATALYFELQLGAASRAEKV